VRAQRTTILYCRLTCTDRGVPDLGKPPLVCALAKSFKGQFARIQFTPDLMPMMSAATPSTTPSQHVLPSVVDPLLLICYWAMKSIGHLQRNNLPCPSHTTEIGTKLTPSCILILSLLDSEDLTVENSHNIDCHWIGPDQA
jgi:hypothetical protein